MSDLFKYRVIFSAMMSCLMAGLMTGWVSWLNLGADFTLGRWGGAFMTAWPAAFAIVLLAAPTVQRLAAGVFERIEGRRLATYK
ncbi:MAG: DUF2798 domain-containing protein [Neisseriaceae bacterium]|nr:DUF2798 domain-containing protein [Neisseriaceae bacterium]MBP6863513.1 DUF2798 domain-containing protein [Neisseriaceae bacterium]